MMAKYSGALAFLQTQHQSAVAMLSNSTSKLVKQKYLSQLVEENIFFGVGFSHLRKQGKPLVTALPVTNGFKVSGYVPWITGFQIFRYFILGAILPSGEELYGVLPFKSVTGNLELSSPFSLGGMNSTNTVSATLEGYFLSNEDIVMIKPAQAIHHKDKQNVLYHGFFPLGCAYAGLDILAENNHRLDLLEAKATEQNLRYQVDNLKEKMLTAVCLTDNFEEKLQLRTTAIDLAYRCAIGGGD